MIFLLILPSDVELGEEWRLPLSQRRLQGSYQGKHSALGGFQTRHPSNQIQHLMSSDV